jgi:hypothetical protein
MKFGLLKITTDSSLASHASSVSAIIYRNSQHRLRKLQYTNDCMRNFLP